jgi:heavy metal sensor kinase
MTLRTRVTFFYTAILAIILLVAFGALLWIQPQVGQALLDSDLRNDAITVEGVLMNELAEGHDHESAAVEMLSELKLPDRAVAVYEPPDRLLAARWAALPSMPHPATAAGNRELFWTVSTPAGPIRVFQRPLGSHDEYIAVVGTSMSHIARNTTTLHWSIALAVPIAIVVAALGGWVVITRALRPLQTMAREAERITALEPHRRLGHTGVPDELAGLGGKINELLDRLSAALDQQREFMADASHELRTPASIARTAAEVTLSSESRSEAEYREALAIVADQTRRMSRLIDDMLLLARADMGRRPIERAAFYLDETVTEAVRSLRVLATPRSVVLESDCAADVQMHGDEGLIRQLAVNLIDNAIRHSPAGGTVGIRLSTNGPHAVLAVSDAGPGVPEGDRGRIFDRFVKLDPARAHDGGAGLGLPIARWIAEMHGGSLVLSGNGSRGSTFKATLTLSTVSESRERSNLAVVS